MSEGILSNGYLTLPPGLTSDQSVIVCMTCHTFVWTTADHDRWHKTIVTVPQPNGTTEVTGAREAAAIRAATAALNYHHHDTSRTVDDWRAIGIELTSALDAWEAYK